MWNAVGHVSSAFALVAFIVAAGVAAYRFHLMGRLHGLKALRPSDRAAAVAREINTYGIRADHLSG